MADFRKSDGKHDDPLAGLTARTLGRSAAPASACPDASVIAACFERSLSDAEIAQHEQHFAGCARCQQQLAVMAQLETAVPASAADPSRAAERRGWRRAWNWKIWAPAAAAFGALALWIVGTSTQQMRAPAGYTAEVAQSRPLESAPPAGSALSADALARKDAPAKPALTERDEAKKDSSKIAGLRDKSAPLSSASDYAFSVTPPPPAPRTDTQPSAKEEHAIIARAESADAAKREGEKTKALAMEPGIATRTGPAAAPPAAAPAEQQQAAKAQAESTQTQQTLHRQRQQPENRDRAAGALMANRAMQMKVVSELVIHAPAPSLTLWRVTAGSKLEKSADSGGVWRAQKLPADVVIFAGSAASEKIVWLVGRAGAVLRTTDGGETWQKLVAPAGVDLTAVSAPNAESATVVDADGRRFVTSDAGRTWRAL